jgi:hypothetical protein
MQAELSRNIKDTRETVSLGFLAGVVFFIIRAPSGPKNA